MHQVVGLLCERWGQVPSAIWAESAADIWNAIRARESDGGPKGPESGPADVAAFLAVANSR